LARKYGPADAWLLAELDSLHDTLSSPATKVLALRAYARFGDARDARLATTRLFWSVPRRRGHLSFNRANTSSVRPVRAAPSRRTPVQCECCIDASAFASAGDQTRAADYVSIRKVLGRTKQFSERKRLRKKACSQSVDLGGAHS
jgi:hypothetical protein